MLYLSEILIQNPDLESFEDLKDALIILAREGELFFRMDVKPPFPDTPSNWEDRLEAVFTSVR
ncbi:MAG: sulfur relay protein DsrC [Gammaproteobacteria bacterium]|nr:sulfur relay protein DsrC [Gammaproteobacteria bacterium]